MNEVETGSNQIDASTIETSLTAVSRKLSGSPQLKHGAILIRFTDSGDDYSIETREREPRLTRAAPATPPLVEISGSSIVLKEIIDGRKDPGRAFMDGGIHVQGDVAYLEALLKEIGLLHCA
jgi:hypothetical protein